MSPEAVAAVAGLSLTIGAALVSIAYMAGRLDARVSSLETWRKEISASLDTIHNGLRHIEQLITEKDA
jgi:hypothetical protein